MGTGCLKANLKEKHPFWAQKHLLPVVLRSQSLPHRIPGLGRDILGGIRHQLVQTNAVGILLHRIPAGFKDEATPGPHPDTL